MDPLTDTKRAVAMQPRSSSASTTNGFTIDARDFKDVVFTALITSIGAATTFTFKLQDSDDGTTWADVAGAALPALLDATVVNDVSPSIKYRRHAGGAKRFVRCVVIIAGTNSAFYGIVAELRNPAQAPV